MKLSQRDRELWLTPILVWVGLMAALGCTVLYAFSPGPGKAEVALSIAAVKVGLIVWIYMKLSSAPPLIRVAASGAFLWIGILFALVFSDYLTRSGRP